ncbi:Hsp33 family molecular chaperone HslO [Gracilibacillus dipsosauri]|uniref:Hsp33 family molecular chaperone HslO n=1 Tax=Gracilibacillus dipsosauri TaxID=178340 RepID=UPI0024090D19
MKNNIIKALIFDKQLRLYFVDNTPLINEIIRRNHQHNRITNVALGKTLSGISLLSATLKEKQRLSATLIMSNPKYKIFADTDASGNVRGYANQNFVNENNSLQNLIGNNASIRMIKGTEMHQFTGITDMPYRDIDKDLSYYFRQSEQLETYLETNLAIDEDNAVLYSYALYAQLLPGAPQQLLTLLKEKINTNSSFFHKCKWSNGNQLQEELRANYINDLEIIDQVPVQFSCGCSKEMFYGLLYQLKENELLEYIQANKPIESACHICGKVYHFYPSELKNLLKKED